MMENVWTVNRAVKCFHPCMRSVSRCFKETRQDECTEKYLLRIDEISCVWRAISRLIRPNEAFRFFFFRPQNVKKDTVSLKSQKMKNNVFLTWNKFIFTSSDSMVCLMAIRGGVDLCVFKKYFPLSKFSRRIQKIITRKKERKEINEQCNGIDFFFQV